MPDAGIGEALAGTLIGDLIFGGGAEAALGAGLAEGAGVGAGLGASTAALDAAGPAFAGFAAESAAVPGAAAALGGSSALGSGIADTVAALGGAGAGAADTAGFTAALGDLGASLGAGTGAVDAGGAAGLGGAADVGGITAAPGVSAAPGVQAAGGGAVSPLSGATPTAAGPTNVPLAGGPSPGQIDLTSSFAQGPGADTFSGATTSQPALGAPGAKELAVPQFGADAPVASLQTPIGSAWDAASSGLKSVGDAINSPTGKLLSTGVAGAGLLKNLSTAPNIPGTAQLAQLAQQLGARQQELAKTGQDLVTSTAPQATAAAGAATDQASTLKNYLNTGTLPPAVQASLDRATQDAIGAIKSQYAARGAPPGSSSEVADIANLKQQAVIKGGTLAAQLYSQGVSQDQLAAQIYSNLLSAGGGLTGAGTSAASAAGSALSNQIGIGTAQNNAVNQAIANLTAALGGGRAATTQAAA